jgi:hypothetical protein
MRASPLGRLALVLVVLAVLGASAVSCSSSGPDLSLTDDTFEIHERVATTRPGINPEAEADLDAAIAAARTSTTTVLGGSSTTSIYVPRTTTTSSSSTSSSSAPDASSTTTTAHVVTPDECRLYSQLLNFYTAIKPQIDASDPTGTAQRISGPVQQSAKGLDQILATAGPDTKSQATTVIDWLRAAAGGQPFEADGAEGAFQELSTWFGINCPK